MAGADRSSTWSPNMVRSFCADPSFLDMGFRLRRRLRIFPGLWINLSKKKGGRGATINVVSYGSGGHFTKGNGSGSKSGSDFYHGPPGEGLGVYRPMR
jgi:hypothetical protein